MAQELNLEMCKQKLQEAGLKVTHQRLLIYQALGGQCTHPNAEAIFEQLSETNPSLSLGTVYRVLDNLVEAGLARRFADEDGKMRFDANLHHHHHLFCEDSSEILDFEDEELNRLLQDYFARRPIHGFNISSFHLHIHGQKPGQADADRPAEA